MEHKERHRSLLPPSNLVTHTHFSPSLLSVSRFLSVRLSFVCLRVSMSVLLSDLPRFPSWARVVYTSTSLTRPMVSSIIWVCVLILSSVLGYSFSTFCWMPHTSLCLPLSSSTPTNTSVLILHYFCRFSPRSWHYRGRTSILGSVIRMHSSPTVI